MPILSRNSRSITGATNGKEKRRDPDHPRGLCSTRNGKRGKLAERCEINREIAAANRDIKAILAEPEPDHRTKSKDKSMSF